MNVLVAGDGVMAVRVVEALMQRHQVVCLHPPDAQSWQLDQLDAEILAGEPTSPQVLESANVARADLFIGCTRSDERNIVASIAAKRLGAKRTVCVLMGQGFLSEGDEGTELARSLGIDDVVRPIDQLAEEMLRIVTVPGALEVADLAGGRVSLIRYAVVDGAPAIRQPLRTLRLPADTRLVHVRRGNDLIVPRGDTELEPGDKVIAMGLRAGLARLGPLLLGQKKRAERHEATIVGGGRVGRAIAQGLARASWEPADAPPPRHRAHRSAGEPLLGGLRGARAARPLGCELGGVRRLRRPDGGSVSLRPPRAARASTAGRDSPRRGSGGRRGDVARDRRARSGAVCLPGTVRSRCLIRIDERLHDHGSHESSRISEHTAAPSICGVRCPSGSEASASSRCSWSCCHGWGSLGDSCSSPKQPVPQQRR